MRYRPTTPLLFLGLVVLALSACGSTPKSRFYTLATVPAETAPKTPADRGLVISVGPVSLPEYLDRPQLVRRKGDTELEFSELHRWAGRLDRQIAQVLVENLRSRLDSNRVAAYGREGGLQPTVRIPIVITAFEADAAGQILLKVHWTLVDADSGTVLSIGSAGFEITTHVIDYAVLVDGHSRALAALSAALARQLRTLPPKKSRDNSRLE